jgi:AraC family transcriptional regulator, regulatory protein of adaptative response / methylated-DNA-[protein]-cysteine methyltransferase
MKGLVDILPMAAAECKNAGEGLAINYSFGSCVFGDVILAATDKGLCHLFFAQDEVSALANLKGCFPNAAYCQRSDRFQCAALSLLQGSAQTQPLRLHVKGTAFQLKVWEALLTISAGQLCSYGRLAQQIGQPKASRAVGGAVGANPIAVIIPCHRVVPADGSLGGYRWGPRRKGVIITCEAAALNS